MSIMKRTMMVAGASLVAMGAVKAGAQQMIHAMTGTVTVADATRGTFTLKEDNGEVKMFQALGPKEKAISFDKDLQSQAKTAEVGVVGSHVLVFFYGYQSVLTAVGVEKLGDAPVKDLEGHVKEFDKHTHTMTLTDVPAEAQTVELSAKTVVDTPAGSWLGCGINRTRANGWVCSQAGAAAEGRSGWCRPRVRTQAGSRLDTTARTLSRAVVSSKAPTYSGASSALKEMRSDLRRPSSDTCCVSRSFVRVRAPRPGSGNSRGQQVKTPAAIERDALDLKHGRTRSKTSSRMFLPTSSDRLSGRGFSRFRCMASPSF